MTAAFKNIAVFRTCALGDAVQCTPLLRQIRADAPNARLTFFTSANVAPLISGAPFVDEVVALKPAWLNPGARRFGQARAWWEISRQGPFDALISLEPTWLRNLGSLCVRSPVKAGINFLGGRKPFELFTHPLEITGDSSQTTVHASLQYLQLWLRATGGKDRDFGYDMKHLLQPALPLELPDERPLIVLAPGSGNVFLRVLTKTWHPARFVELGSRLQERGWQVAYLGAADDLAGHEAPAGTLDLLGKTSFRQAAQILHRAAAMVGNDSGLFHLAQGLDCPALGIFGSTSPRFTGSFRAARAMTLQSGLPCDGCYLHQCAPPTGVRAMGLELPCCMSTITAGQVVQAVEGLARNIPSLHILSA